MAEEKTRSIVSRIGTGLLIFDQLAADLPQTVPGGVSLLGSAPQSSSEYRSATEGLANTIKDDFTASVREYGLEIHRVALQELRLPPEIYAAAVEACKSAYLPLKAKAEALERKMKLQAGSGRNRCRGGRAQGNCWQYSRPGLSGVPDPTVP